MIAEVWQVRLGWENLVRMSLEETTLKKALVMDTDMRLAVLIGGMNVGIEVEL